MTRTRGVQIHLMLNEDEDALLTKRAQDCGMSKSQYLRYMIINIQPKVIPAVADETHHQLLKIGNNINQIARRLNSGDRVPDFEVSDAMTSLKAVIADIRK